MRPALLSLLALLICVPLTGCPGGGDTAKTPAPTGRRVAAVKPKKSGGAVNDTGGFCEATYAADVAPAFAWPPERALPDGTTPPAKLATDRWTWVNVWATWCRPCVEEMGLMARWTRGLEKEGRPIDLQLLTIDKVDDQAKLAERMKKGVPGKVRWIREEADFGPFLDSIKVDRNAAIPIHALVDPAGKLRCVRVGAISGQDFAAVKAIIRGG